LLMPTHGFSDPFMSNGKSGRRSCSLQTEKQREINHKKGKVKARTQSLSTTIDNSCVQSHTVFR